MQMYLLRFQNYDFFYPLDFAAGPSLLLIDVKNALIVFFVFENQAFIFQIAKSPGRGFNQCLTPRGMIQCEQ